MDISKDKNLEETSSQMIYFISKKLSSQMASPWLFVAQLSLH